jgi:hypothetical protein
VGFFYLYLGAIHWRGSLPWKEDYCRFESYHSDEYGDRGLIPLGTSCVIVKCHHAVRGIYFDLWYNGIILDFDSSDSGSTPDRSTVFSSLIG